MADRSSLESRIEEKQATVARLEEEEAVNQIEKLRVKAFLSIVAPSIRTEDPLPTLDETLTRWNEEGSLDCAILTPEYDSLTSRILQAREFIRSHAMLLTHSTTDFGQWLKDNKLDLSGIDYDEAQHVFGTEVERLQKEYRESLAKVPGARPMIPLASPSATIPPVLLSRRASSFPTPQQRLTERLEQIRFDLKRATAELAELKDRLRHFKYPVPPLFPMFMLVILVLLGVIYPLWLMPSDSLRLVDRIFILSGISISTVGLVGYLAYEFRKRTNEKT